MSNQIKLEIIVDDKGTATVKQFGKDTEKAFDDAGKSTEDFKDDLDDASGGMEDLDSEASKTLLTIGALGAAFVAAAASFVLKESIQEFAEFESALTDMGKVTSESFESITARIQELPPELGTATELVKGYYQVISAGVTEPVAAIETLTTASQLAKTAHVEQAEVIIGLTSVMDAFGTSSIGSADALQIMEKTGKTSVGALIPVIGELSSGSAALGLSLEEMGAAFAAVTLQSGGTEKAATQFKALLTSLISPTTEMAELLGEYGGAQEAIKEIGFGGVLKLIADETGGNAAATKKLVGSVEAYLGFLSASAKDMATYNQNLGEQKEKTGALAKAWEDYGETLNAIWDTFKNTVTNQFIMIGKDLAPAIKKVIERSGEWLEANQEIITQDIAASIDAITISVKALAEVYKYWSKVFDMGDPILKHLEAQKKAIEDEIAILKSFDLAWAEMLETSESVVDAISGINLEIELLEKQLKNVNQTIANYKKEQEGAKQATEEVRNVVYEVGLAMGDLAVTQEETTKKTEETSEAIKALTDYYSKYTGEAMAGIYETVRAEEALAEAVEEGIKEVTKSIDENKTRFDLYESGIANMIASEEALAKAVEEGVSESTKSIEEATRDRLHAYESMYDDLKGYAWDSYENQVELIAAQAAIYMQYTDDVAVVTAWMQQEIEEAWINSAIAGDSFIQGMKAGFLDLENSMMTWGEAGYQTVVDFSTNSESALSTIFFDAAKFHMDSLGEYWQDFLDSMLAALMDILAQMATEWAMSEIFELISGGFNISIGESGGTGILDLLGLGSTAASAGTSGAAAVSAEALIGTTGGMMGTEYLAGAEIGIASTAALYAGIAGIALLAYDAWASSAERVAAVEAAWTAASSEERAEWLQAEYETGQTFWASMSSLADETWSALAALRGEDVEDTKSYFTTVEAMHSEYSQLFNSLIEGGTQAQQDALTQMEAAIDYFVSGGEETFAEYYANWKEHMEDLVEQQAWTAEGLQETWSDAYKTMTEVEEAWADAGLLIIEEFVSEATELLGTLSHSDIMITATAIAAEEEAAILRAGVLHGGGIAGIDQVPTRLIPAMAFADAQRAHFGLGPTERPVIINEDEGIFTPAQMRALGKGNSEQKNRPLVVYVQVGNEDFEAYIDGRADNIRVKAERRNMGTSRICH